MVEATQTVQNEFFAVPEGAKTVKDLITKNEQNQYELEVSAKKNISHDTILLTFKFPDPEWILGGNVSEHVLIYNKPDCNPPRKPYTSISPINQKGTIDFVIKVYEKTEQYPNDKLTQYLNSLKVGDKALFAPPFGKVNYWTLSSSLQNLLGRLEYK